MKFKKQLNGNIKITDDSDVNIHLIENIPAVIAVMDDNETIEIRQNGILAFQFQSSDVSAYQLLPAAEVPFVGNASDFIDILSLYFFFIVSDVVSDVNIVSPDPLPVVFAAEDLGEPFGIDRDTMPLTTGNTSTLRALFAIRLNASFPDSIVSLRDFTIMCTSSSAYNVQVILNPTISGDALVWTALSGSSIDFDATKTNATTVTGGTVLRSFSAAQINQGGQFEGDLSDIKLQGSDIIVIAVRRLTGASETFFGSLNLNDKQ